MFVQLFTLKWYVQKKNKNQDLLLLQVPVDLLLSGQSVRQQKLHSKFKNDKYCQEFLKPQPVKQQMTTNKKTAILFHPPDQGLQNQSVRPSMKRNKTAPSGMISTTGSLSHLLNPFYPQLLSALPTICCCLRPPHPKN